MVTIIRELIRYRDLIYVIVLRDIKIKYKQSIMGFVWAIFMPVIIIIAGVLVKLAMAHISGQPLVMTDIASVSVKALPWAFLVASIRFGTSSLTGNQNLVTKIYFPKEIFPICAVLSQLFDFLVASCVLVTILAIARIGLSGYLCWVPGLFLLTVLNALFLSILLSVANLFFRDVKYIVEVVLNFAIFFTPVFYDAKLAGKWTWIIMLNPVAPLLEGFNSTIVLHQAPALDWIAYSGIVAVLGVLIALAIFKSLEQKFAECI
jgi:lipopolysaccharide transport system permease protein